MLIMSRPVEQRYFFKHWSDSTLRKYCPHLQATSEEEINLAQRAGLKSPILLTGVQRRGSGDEHFTACCHCQIHCAKKKSSKYLLSDETKKLHNRQLEKIKEGMRLRLVESQVEVALADDKQAALMEYLELVTDALEALIHYGQSAKIVDLAAHRIIETSRLLACPHSNFGNDSLSIKNTIATQFQQIESRKENRSLFLEDLIEYCSKSIVISKELGVVLEDHRLRKEDFCVATKNLRNLLDSSKLSISQMENLRGQYDTIINDYQQNRRMLDAELPKIVNTRLEALCEGFGKLIELYTDMEYFKQFATLLKLLGQFLSRDTPVKENTRAKELEGETCHVCKTKIVERIT